MIIWFFNATNYAVAITTDSISTTELNAYTWTPISGTENILQHEKDLTKRSLDQSKLAADHYSEAINLMKKKYLQQEE